MARGRERRSPGQHVGVGVGAGPGRVRLLRRAPPGTAAPPPLVRADGRGLHRPVVDTARPRPDHAGGRGAGAAPARVRPDAALLHAQGTLSAARRALLRAVAQPAGVDLPSLIRAARGPLIRPIWPARPRPPGLRPGFPLA